MAVPSTEKRRIDTDVMKLIENKHEVTIIGGLNQFSVKFFGPKGTPYEGGVWMVNVQLTNQYPLKSPIIEFINKIFHPNICDKSGAVCLDVINKAWTPLYDLCTIFELFLPQLLIYPSPMDPLNPMAASMYLQEPVKYKKTVSDYIRQFATEEALRVLRKNDSSDSESSISDSSEDEA